MTLQLINTGTNPNDGTGDNPRSGAAKMNANATELFRASPSIGAQRSVGERLRRARNRGLMNCALNSAPLIAAPAWAASTAYQRGQIALNGGLLYLNCGGTAAGTISGTSASSGTGPSGTSTAPQTDGSTSWVYYGMPLQAASDALAPTVTTSTAPNSNSTLTALTKIYYLTPSSSPLRYFGTIPGSTGFQTPTGGSNKTYPPASYYKTINNTTTPLNNGGLVQFMSDAPKIVINVGAATTNAFNFRIAVDNLDGRGWRYLQQGAFVVPSGLGDPQYGVLIDWSATSGKRPRAYRVETGPNTGLNSVRISPLDTLWLTPATEDVRAYFLSDSWGEGIAGNVLGGSNQIAGMGMGWQMMQRLGITNHLQDVAGGTGYVSTNSGASNTYLTRAANVATFLPDIVFVDEAVINDSSSTASALQTAAANTFTAIRAAGAYIPIVVFGAGIRTSNDATSYASLDAAVGAAVTAMQNAGDPYIFFLSRLTDPQGVWSSGTGKSSAVAGDGNSDVFTTSDGHHPTDLGALYEGQRLADAFCNYVLPFIP